MIIVPDAGPLTYLAGAGHNRLLPALYIEVIVPRVVFDEVVVAGAGLTGASEVQGATWLRVEDAPIDPLLLEVLDRGEAAAIPLAERLQATLLVDDLQAREIARQRELTIVGSLGVLLAAKRRGLIAAVGPIVLRMEALGMFLSGELRDAVLRAAAES